jgi:hypothetical protein
MEVGPQLSKSVFFIKGEHRVKNVKRQEEKKTERCENTSRLSQPASAPSWVRV